MGLHLNRDIGRQTAVVVAAIAVVLGVAGTASAAPSRALPITPTSFGIHAYQGDPQVPAGSIRLACAPKWRDIQPTRNTWHWDHFDTLMNRVQGWGFNDVLFSFCGAPNWAASSLGNPDNLADWETFVRATVRRYAADIDAWEVWNEATSPYFFEGPASRMGQMTKIVNDVVNEYDPSGTVLSASMQTHRPEWVNSFAKPYLKYLKRHNWPLDALALHTYTLTDPWSREKDVRSVLRVVQKKKPPKRVKIWDTESNSWVKPTGNKQGALLARTYLESWNLGIKRTYWYLWTEQYYDFVGVQLMPGARAVTSFNLIHSWTKKSKFKGCEKSKKLNVCSFKKRGRSFDIAYSSKGRSKLSLDGKRTVCPVTGADCSKKRKRLTVSMVPVRITR